jgi:anaerobic selenocysteine-containing dehydrogenase
LPWRFPAERVLRPSVGQARLASPPAPASKQAGEHEFLLTTVRSHDQHNSTLYGHGDRERGLAGYRRVVYMNLADFDRLGIEPFDQVDLISEFADEQRRAPRWVAVPHHIGVGMLAAYWPEANVLVPSGHVDRRSGVPAYKSVVVRVEPAR